MSDSDSNSSIRDCIEMDWQSEEKLEPYVSVTPPLLKSIKTNFPTGIAANQQIEPVRRSAPVRCSRRLHLMAPVGNERSSLTITSAFAISGASTHGGAWWQQYSSSRTSTSAPTESFENDKNNKTNPNERRNYSGSRKHKDDAEAREKREVYENMIRRKLQENNANSSDIKYNRELKRNVQKEAEKFLNKNLNLNTTGK